MAVIGRALAVLAALCCVGAAPARSDAPAPAPVIIDTDVGDDLDDAFALAVALSDPRLDVIGVTTAWGDTRARVRLVRRLLAAMGRRDVAVAQGPATADTVPFTQKRWAEGAAQTGPAPDAIDFIRAQVARRPGRITLLALAPLSNVQALIARDPSAFRGLKQVVMMGGSIHAGYRRPASTTPSPPSAEYNVASAPGAFAALLATGTPVTLFPLDSTQIQLTESERRRLFAHGSGADEALAQLYQQWRALNSWGQSNPTLFDVAPTAWLIDPSICAPKPLRIAVDASGYTRPVEGTPNAAVCLTENAGAVRALTLADLATDSKRTP